MQNFAIVRHGISEEIGPRQNKQTLFGRLGQQYITECYKDCTSAEELWKMLSGPRVTDTRLKVEALNDQFQGAFMLNLSLSTITMYVING